MIDNDTDDMQFRTNVDHGQITSLVRRIVCKYRFVNTGSGDCVGVNIKQSTETNRYINVQKRSLYTS